MPNQTQGVSRLEFIRSFIQAATHVLGEVVGEVPVAGTPQFQVGSLIRLGDVSVSLGITGEVPGQVNYGMDMQTSLNIAAAMLMEPCESHDEMSLSALQELGNMISGNARTHLSRLNVVTDITPPKTVVGRDIRANWHRIRAMSVPLALSHGTITLVVGLQE